MFDFRNVKATAWPHPLESAGKIHKTRPGHSFQFFGIRQTSFVLHVATCEPVSEYEYELQHILES
jgi:hypothetical protein